MSILSATGLSAVGSILQMSKPLLNTIVRPSAESEYANIWSSVNSVIARSLPVSSERRRMLRTPLASQR